MTSGNFILDHSSKEHLERLIEDLESRDEVPNVGAHLIENRDFDPATVSLIWGRYNVRPDYVGPVTWDTCTDPNLNVFELEHGVYITAYDGIREAYVKSHVIINTHSGLSRQDDPSSYALEIEYMIDFNCFVEPFYSGLNDALDRGASLINDHWIAGEDVTVNCAMGMERSVLLVARWLTKYQGVGENQAFEFLSEKRPIAIDRREWII